jgi:hypothetical protein
VAGGTQQSQLNIFMMVVKNLTDAVTGHPVTNVVNGLSPLLQRRLPIE